MKTNSHKKDFTLKHLLKDPKVHSEMLLFSSSSSPLLYCCCFQAPPPTLSPDAYVNSVHLMCGPKGNSQICFPESPDVRLRETSGLEGKQNYR